MFELKNINIINKGGTLVFKDLLSLTIQKNEIWQFKGSNGIGKTSVFESFIGLRSICQGEIWHNDKRIDQLSPQKRIKLGIKYIGQENALFESLSVYDNLKICAEFLVEKKEQTSVIEEALTMFALTELKHKYAGELSGGQKRLVELSKLIIGKIDIVLMDEPFAAIDEVMIEYLQNIFKKLKTEKEISFFINDHNSKAINAISNMQLEITKTKTAINILNHNK